jgi:hypothetical protein
MNLAAGMDRTTGMDRAVEITGLLR